MTQPNSKSSRTRWLRIALVALLVAVLAGGVYTVWPSRGGQQVDRVLPLGGRAVPGRRRQRGRGAGRHHRLDRATCLRRQGHHDRARRRQAARRRAQRSSSRRTWCPPGSFSSPPPTPAGPCWPTARGSGSTAPVSPSSGTRSRSSSPQLSAQLGPQQGGAAGAAQSRSSTRPPTRSTATATRSGRRCANCPRPQGASATRATDLFGTVRNLQVLVNALSNSNEQIVQFSNHVASVSQVLADSQQGSRRHARHAQPGAERCARASSTRTTRR